jgi:hypothetical protein
MIFAEWFAEWLWHAMLILGALYGLYKGLGAVGITWTGGQYALVAQTGMKATAPGVVL